MLTVRPAWASIGQLAPRNNGIISTVGPSRRRRFSWLWVLTGAFAVVAAGMALLVR
jgi:hypothetical protein